MLPQALATLVAEVRAGRRQVVECGSGVSTVVLARALGEADGRLHSLEHDPAWAARIRSLLVDEGLDRFAGIVESPLAPHPAALDGGSWYGGEALAELPEAGVDLLLVDGPPAGEPGRARSRYPALPILGSRLTEDALVVLDDAHRPGETAVLAAWERESDLRFQRLDEQRIALGRREAEAVDSI